MKVKVDVVQYLRPSGTQRSTTTMLDIPSYLYEQMRKHECRFEAEILITGEVSLTISDTEQDLDIEIVSNGPEVQKAMERMLHRQAWSKKKED